MYTYIRIYMYVYCRARVLGVCNPASDDTPRAIIIREKKTLQKACCENYPGSHFSGFANGPQRKCLYIKFVH